jgi:hypothetical protein
MTNLTASGAAGNGNGRPHGINGRPLDLLTRASRQNETVSPVSADEIVVLFACCWHDLEFFNAAREQLQQQHWDDSEPSCYWLWYVLTELVNSRATYPSVSPTVSTVILRVESLLRQHTAFDVLPQEIRDSVLSQDPAVGLIAAAANTAVDPALLHAGRQILTRIVRERAIIAPLHRAFFLRPLWTVLTVSI